MLICAVKTKNENKECSKWQKRKRPRVNVPDQGTPSTSWREK